MNWKNLLAELAELGLTQNQIAARCKCAQATISGLAIGSSSEPRHGLGEKLIACLKQARKSNARKEAKAAAMHCSTLPHPARQAINNMSEPGV